MLKKIVFCLIFLPFGLSLERNVNKMTLDYFIYRNVKLLCVFTCERNNNWLYKFAKDAHHKSIAVSYLNLQTGNVNYEKVGKCLQQMFEPVGALIDANCFEFEEIMTLSSKNMMFDRVHKWLIVTEKTQIFNIENSTEFGNDFNGIFSDDNLTDLVQILGNLNISVDADIVILTNQEPDKYDLYEPVNFGKAQGGDLKTTKIGSWSNDNGLTLTYDINQFKYYRRWDFRQLTMKMVIVVKDPPEHFDFELINGQAPVPGVALLTQVSSSIINVIADIHHIRFQYTIAEQWIGNLSKEHSKKVVVTSIYHREQDISPVIRIYPETITIIDYVFPPVTSIETRYYYRIPTYGPGKLENQFLRPLTPAAWLCVISLTILCAIGLLLSAKFENRPEPFQFALFSVFASFCQQFYEDSSEPAIPRVSNARKAAILVTGLSCVLIYNYYTSSVVSWLLNGPPPSINSLEELLESPLELIFEDIGYTRSWLQIPSYYYNKKNAKVEDELRRKKVLSKKKGAPLLIQPDEGIEMIKAGGYAYHTEINTANTLISKKFNQMELCELGSLQSMNKALLYPILQKHSPFKEFFTWSLMRAKERGIIACIQRRTSSVSIACEGSSPRALALGGAAPAFLLLAFGYFCAVVIMLVERIAYKKLNDIQPTTYNP